MTQMSIENIVLTKKAEELGFWIKGINRSKVHTFEGTTVMLANQNSEDVAKVTFGKFFVKIDGEDFLEFEEDINKAYQKYLFEIVPDSKKHFDEHMKDIEDNVQDIRRKLISEFNDKGYLSKEDARLLLCDPKKGLELMGKTFQESHGEYLEPLQNQYFTSERLVSNGDVYLANLNPVLKGEFGGIRPVLVVRNIAINAVVVPFSSNTSPKALKPDFLIKKREKMLNDSYLYTDIIKTIHKSRLYTKLAQLNNSEMECIRKNMVYKLLGEDYINLQRDNLLVPSGIEMLNRYNATPDSETLLGGGGTTFGDQRSKLCA